MNVILTTIFSGIIICLLFGLFCLFIGYFYNKTKHYRKIIDDMNDEHEMEIDEMEFDKSDVCDGSEVNALMTDNGEAEFDKNCNTIASEGI